MAHPKGVLLERVQKLGLERPEFRTVRTGPEHEPNFITDVVLEGEVIGTGQGGTKRTAEKHAAEEALAALAARYDDQPAAKGRKTDAAADGKGAKGAAKPAKGAAKADAKAEAKAGGSDRAAAAQPAAAKGAQAKPAAAKPQPAPAAKAGAAASEPAAPRAAQAPAEAEAEEEPFDGPWPMFDDLLAAAVTVAERRVFADLRGEDARVAIRDFALALYKELLLGLGEIEEVEEEEE